jgi:hypothetical protein
MSNLQLLHTFSLSENISHCRTELSVLTLSDFQFFYHPHTPQLLFILGRKEVGGLLVIILEF